MTTAFATQSRPANPTTSREHLAGKYLTFNLGGESYGLPVIRVREIIRMMDEFTRVPQMPDFVLGCMNLRGRVIPVVDLRKKFGFKPCAEQELNCIVVASVKLGPDDELLMGLTVDAVEEVANVKTGDLEPAPRFGAGLSTKFILGMAKINDRVKTLLDLDRVISADVMEALQEETNALAPEQAVSPVLS